MSSLARTRRVACPLSHAARYVREYFRELIGEHGDAARIALGRAADQPVTATLLNITRPGRSEPTYEITWTPENPTLPLPLFSGRLHLAEASTDAVELRLTGTYRPPLGVVGAAFDAAVGHRIAEATADDFLARIATRLEGEYARESGR